jgi:ketosteroid isomerase-like protein
VSANVELARSIFVAWARGDYSDVSWAHPDIEFVLADGPEPRTWTGLEGMSQGWREFLSAWQDWRGEAEGYRELDAERVLVLIVGSGRGKTSGLDAGRMRTKGANLLQVVDGKIRRLVIYFSRENAFADLGLEPQDDARAALS